MLNNRSISSICENYTVSMFYFIGFYFSHLRTAVCFKMFVEDPHYLYDVLSKLL